MTTLVLARACRCAASLFVCGRRRCIQGRGQIHLCRASWWVPSQCSLGVHVDAESDVSVMLRVYPHTLMFMLSALPITVSGTGFGVHSCGVLVYDEMLGDPITLRTCRARVSRTHCHRTRALLLDDARRVHEHNHGPWMPFRAPPLTIVTSSCRVSV
jgi:hypothetical protein